jgi:hypothetical protein
MAIFTIRDPIQPKTVVEFSHEAGWEEGDVPVLVALSRRYMLTMMEIFKMISVEFWGLEALQENWSLDNEMRQRVWEAEQDASLLKLKESLPVEELFAIWERSIEGLQRLAFLYPRQAEEIEAMIEASRSRLLERLNGKR